ncbi:methylated-DNA--protein-cysteine methyltransferase isoform X5 [Willisornis vidua]|uniref:Methylated-DNA--protein-cysteine methyltransferase n=1 Tax=Willisornis vidua TaxID=1566151 RepID=A0ABQ9DJ00_9PASS|nr:methylated-DNA--protein-cysteine methyltransferase isoform X5 [Willisornis vidua]
MQVGSRGSGVKGEDAKEEEEALQVYSFTRQVLWTLLNDVKFGEAVSYKQLAHLAGHSRAARAVGSAMRINPNWVGLQRQRLAPVVLYQEPNSSVVAALSTLGMARTPPVCHPVLDLWLMESQDHQIPIIIPCHRVIRSSGDTGNYGAGQLLKEWLLSHEKLQKEKLAH